MNFYVWLAVFAVLILIGFILDREIYFYEGVHLGPRIQAWLYDRWSKKYDRGKRESQLRDQEFLAQPFCWRLSKMCRNRSCWISRQAPVACLTR